MSFQIQAGKLKSHSGPHGSHAVEGYITVGRNSDGFLSKRKKKGICPVLTNLPGKSGYNLGTVEQVEKTYTGEHVNWQMPYGYKELLPSSGLSPSCKLHTMPLNTLPANSPAQKSTAEDVLWIISARKPRAGICGQMQGSTLINLLSMHTMQATSQSHL